MIEAFGAYIENIVGLMIVTALAEVIMPKGNFKKYIRFVTGLIIVAAVTEPAAKLIYGKGYELELKDTYFNRTNEEQNDILNEIYLKEIENNCKDMAKMQGIEISEIQTDDDNGRLNRLEIYAKADHVCVDEVWIKDKKETACEECALAEEELEKTLTEVTGIKDVDAKILKVNG